MVRGHAKEAAREKAAKKHAAAPGSQLKSRDAALKSVCPVCKTPCTNHKMLTQHMESKHPGVAIPPPYAANA